MTVAPNQHQMFRHGSAMGSAAGQCRVEAPAVADHLQDRPLMRAGSITSNFCSRTGGGLGRPAFHHFDFRTQPSRQSIVRVLPSHFQISVSVAGIKPSQGVVGDVRNYEGEARSV